MKKGSKSASAWELKQQGYTVKEITEMLGINRSTVYRRIQREKVKAYEATDLTAVDDVSDMSDAGKNITVKSDGDQTVISNRGRIQSLDELLKEAKVDRNKWAIKNWVANKWDAMTKEGQVPMWQIKVWLERIPAFMLEPVKAVKPLPRQPSRGSERDVERALIIPDSQNGYRVNRRDNTYRPLHDRKAWDLAIQVAQRMQPQYIVMLGDMCDFAPFGKYTTTSDLSFTTRPTLLELHWWLSQLRLAAPAARIIYLEGNHEARLAKIMCDSVKEAVDLSAVNRDLPALSVPALLDLESLDIEYLGPYPEGDFWLFDTVHILHGVVVRGKSGATTQAVIREASHSTVFGHIHRVEMASRTIQTKDGRRFIYSMSPGCITALDGAVPGSSKRSNWQQGLGVVDKTTTPDGEEHVSMFPVPISDGTIIWDGNVLYGEDRTDEIREATGFHGF